ncbi:hypothetical protein LIER_07601 [Lithospermum erythrorhizon]|uniref:Polygalacturonase n=1 Tax=Lithospermum erythrorhizon TaxID=34254 RepID=A0AAV3PBL1_LITER
MGNNLLIIISLILLLFHQTNAGLVTFNVIKFGAKGDEKTDSTKAFMDAWKSACDESVEATRIFVPKGRYLLKEIDFRGPCLSSIIFKIDGTLVAPDDYTVHGDSGNWILFAQVSKLSVVGGRLDGKGGGFWECRDSGKDCHGGARSITFRSVNDTSISGLLSVNSQLMHLVINGCNNVKIRGVQIIAPDLSPNTDGIHVEGSNNVTITTCSIKTGDDCISIGPGTKNLWMDRIHCGPGHGISIGSLAKEFEEEGVENVTLINSLFTGSNNGLRIKSWARPSKGFVRNINYRNIVMRNVENPILIDQYYCPDNIGCPKQSSGVKISDVTYQNVQGTSATKTAMEFDCSPSTPCTGIKLQDIKLTYLNKQPQSICHNVRGTTSGVITPVNCL